MEQFPKFIASRLARQQQPAEVHPEADQLTAFAEKRLPRAECRTLMEHLAVCAECREVLALVSVTTDEQPDVKHKPAVTWWRWRWAAGFLVVGLLMFTVFRSPSRVPPAVQVPVEPATVALSKPPSASSVAEPKPNVKKALPEIPRASTPRIALPPKAYVPDLDRTAVTAPASPAVSQTSSSSALGMMPMSKLAIARSMPVTKAPLWMIDEAPGTLRMSNDGGQTWAAVVVDSHTPLQSIFVSESEVWAGGDDGALFHSMDSGLHWKEVPVGDGTNRLSETITRIETTRTGLVRVKTKSDVWVSADGGDNWTKH